LVSALEIIRAMECEAHGITKWQGHLFCCECGETYQIKDPSRPFFAPVTCRCGAQLRADPIEWFSIGNGDDGTAARTMCFHCFRHFRKRSGGRVPVEERKAN
jgi:hypothetical protein